MKKIVFNLVKKYYELKIKIKGDNLNDLIMIEFMNEKLGEN